MLDKKHEVLRHRRDYQRDICCILCDFTADFTSCLPDQQLFAGPSLVGSAVEVRSCFAPTRARRPTVGEEPCRVLPALRHEA